jgi:uncharacterized protein
MKQNEISKLIDEGAFPDGWGKPELVETHISWALIFSDYVFKIKKPIRYSFLDFSTLSKRLFYCEREVKLNQRLTSDMYLEVTPIRKTPDGFSLGRGEGEVVDFAVKMRKQNRERQMDVLLKKNEVAPSDIQRLAQRIASFHKKATVVKRKDILSVREKFNDLALEVGFLNEQLGSWTNQVIASAIRQSNDFFTNSSRLLEGRLKAGYVRDGHGDLHSRNIFLLPEPVIFDCIEFNDEYRQIDVLNEVAFLCMDLDAFNRTVLSDLLINDYDELFPTLKSDADKQLFIYYKAYRANVRAKVNSLRAKDAQGEARKKALDEAEKYLKLMERYFRTI